MKTIPIPGWVIVCPHLWDGASVVSVRRYKDYRGEHVYGLTCVENHDGQDVEPVLAHGGCVAARDPTLARIPDLSVGQTMVRSGPGAPWRLLEDFRDVN